ncbi:hypothetical protein GE21DRAFT_5431 [Neurospora crassa]|uniref:Uncharacterized protein n=1 Tax=Neurospora crassa (strain ATCC 24698 / 74-OR23-1A / CBS 708.71 / DSM 1257 / FGSC 987) TaxID=367110 RepID=Q7S847_NEUCR|nr:hypothetical protein NCU07973 [Neurospora crassa OR74A]EAA32509.1 hypothetical protein NCU07973 [Neurospora crassa OR74A]KHE85936.1 hypothetical protein GE21DRAFT_5431 [Neurospora crassa]|eukprot:XP_961745.1 hypothetical protein NCU07973 [Neurospora crassa OR74A]
MSGPRVSRVQGQWQDPRVKNQRLLLDRTWFLSHPASDPADKWVIVLSSILPRKEPTDLSQLADKADDRPDKAEKFADPTVVQISGDTCAQAVSIVHLAETELGRQIAKLCICSA